MVIHTVIDEYDLLYAQEREAAYAKETTAEAAELKALTQLPDLRKGHSNDNS